MTIVADPEDDDQPAYMDWTCDEYKRMRDENAERRKRMDDMDRDTPAPSPA